MDVASVHNILSWFPLCIKVTVVVYLSQYSELSVVSSYVMDVASVHNILSWFPLCIKVTVVVY